MGKLLRNVFLLGAGFGIFGGTSLTVSADTQTLTPSQWTQIQAPGSSVDKSGEVLYQEGATAYVCSYSVVSGGAFENKLDKYEGTPVVIAKFDAATLLEGMNLIKATLRYTAKCTVSGKNSNVQVALIGTGWDATTATWNNTNTAGIMNAVCIDEVANGVNVKTTAKELSLDVTSYLKADSDKVVGFGIYTFTGREQQITNMALDIEYVDPNSAATYKVAFVDEAGEVLRDTVSYTVSVGDSIVLSEADKAPIYNADKTAKWMYKSDDAAGRTVAKGDSTIVTVVFRAAEQWAYQLNAVNGDSLMAEAIKTGAAFEQEQFSLGYPTYFLAPDSTLYQAGKYSSDKKGYYLAFNLDANNKSQDVNYPTVAKSGVVFYKEAEDIAGLTLATNGNTAIRSSNGASAYAAEEDVELTTLPAGKYKLTVCICDAKSSHNSEWDFRAAGDTIFHYATTAINYVEGTSDEFALMKATPIYLCKGGNAQQAVDFVYVQKTGDVELPVMTPYTVRYVNAAGEELKAARQDSALWGDTVAITAEDKATFYNEARTAKYIYQSDDAEGLTVAKDSSTVVSVLFREAEKWHYALNAVAPDSTVLKAAYVSGESFEGETFQLPYYAYYNNEGTLYSAPKLGSKKKGYLLDAFELTEDGKNEDITYTATTKTGVVVYREAEEIEGLTEVTTPNSLIRSSRGAAAYADSADVAVATLPAGKYKMTVVICDAAKTVDSYWAFTASGDTIMNYHATKTNWSEGTSDEFELSGETEIVLCKGGSATAGVDFFYIQKTGEYVDGINAVGARTDLSNAPIYNLQGQRITMPRRGIYIQNGKKHIAK